MALSQSEVRRGNRGNLVGPDQVAVGRAKADAAGLACYLETATGTNVTFYGKRGEWRRTKSTELAWLGDGLKAGVNRVG